MTADQRSVISAIDGENKAIFTASNTKRNDE